MRRVLVALLAVVLFALPMQTRAATSGARASLQVVLPVAKFDNISLGDAIQFMRDVTNANIVVDWKSLQDLNISKDTTINIDLRRVRLEKVLSLVLNEAAPGDLLTWYIDENVIHVTTQAVEDQKLLTIVYYVDDLLSMDDDFDPTITTTATFGNNSGTSGGNSGTGLSGRSTGSTTGTGGAGGGSGLFGNQTTGSSSGQSNATKKEDRAKALIKMIETVIRPEVWKDNGGTAVIEYFNGHLIVSAPRSVQEAIGGPVN